MALKIMLTLFLVVPPVSIFIVGLDVNPGLYIAAFCAGFPILMLALYIVWFQPGKSGKKGEVILKKLLIFLLVVAVIIAVGMGIINVKVDNNKLDQVKQEVQSHLKK